MTGKKEREIKKEQERGKGRGEERKGGRKEDKNVPIPAKVK